MLAVSVELRKAWEAAGRTFRLDLQFAISAGITILFGASGAGKTTLLDCIAGLTIPDSGRIVVEDRVLFDSEEGTNVAVRDRKIGYLFQDLALFPHLSVEKNVGYGLVRVAREEKMRRVSQLLESFRVSHLASRSPQAISGGERQRVALARALVTEPALLLLDEPMSAIDIPTKAKILDDLLAWNQLHRVPILYVTHNRDEVFALGERVLVLEHGKLIASGTPHEVMSAPRQETVAQLAGFENIFDVVVSAIHEERGTMTCRITGSEVELETPLVRAEVQTRLRVGIRAGDILLATVLPEGLSARNMIRGRIRSLSRRDVIVTATVDCGIDVAAHLTLAAQEALALQPGREVWLVVKTHSCHLLAR